jgi:hypothetical protein
LSCSLVIVYYLLFTVINLNMFTKMFTKGSFSAKAVRARPSGPRTGTATGYHYPGRMIMRFGNIRTGASAGVCEGG